MKADLSRNSDQPAKHYRAVRMQQGRVQLDADWNEQQAITNRRIELETRDTLGAAAGPVVGAGFALVGNGQNIDISAGHYYVDGLLCRNEAATTVIRQPHLPAAVSPIMPSGAGLLALAPAAATALSALRVYSNGAAVAPANGLYIAYLEVWLRHITALEDEQIRETALGGPDTCSRDQLLWQVKLLRAADLGANFDCHSPLAAWDELTAARTGAMAARAQPSAVPTDPCLLSPEAGYRRLENQLYRVEIHDDGSLSGKLVYKWSRDNGTVISRVSQPLAAAPANEFEVNSIGRDAVLAISAGCWLEFIDDQHELLGRPGTLVKVLKTEGNRVTVDLASKTGPLDAALFASNPRVRRWDGWNEMSPQPAAAPYNSGWVALEDGIQIKFQSGTYRCGDYWTLAARTATADVEWPQAADGKALMQPAEGILRAFSRLAVLECNNGQWTTRHDCRQLFPALSELTNLYYVGGDGQQAQPNPLNPQPVALANPLEVAVFNGQWPQAGAMVRYSASHGLLSAVAGTVQRQVLDGGRTLIVETRADGSAAVSWQLDPGVVQQQCQAELLSGGQPQAGRFNDIRFSAQLAQAAQLAYDPQNAPELLALGINNVQDALDALANRPAGGGCCVTIGQGGDFAQLDEALEQLLKQGKFDLCLCLLPGDHQLRDSIDVADERLNLRIHGSGPASRLLLRGEEVLLQQLPSLILRDFDIFCLGESQQIQLIECRQLQLHNLRLRGQSNDGQSLLQISDCEQLAIENCLLLSHQPLELNVNQLLTAVPALKLLGKVLTARASARYQPLDAGLVNQFASFDQNQQRQLAEQVAALVNVSAAPRASAVALNSAARGALTGLVAAVASGQSQAAVREALELLREVILASAPGNTLLLGGVFGQMRISHSQINGLLSLYDEAGKGELLPAALAARLHDTLRKRPAALRAGRGELRLLHNQLQQVMVGSGYREALRQLADNPTATLSQTSLRLLQVEGNSIAGESWLLAALELGFNHNSVRPHGGMGMAVAAQGNYLANFARQATALTAIGHVPVELGNGFLDIVPS